jgi:hypothetical protein
MADSHGRFLDELFPTWGEKFVPRGFMALTIIGYIDNSEHYATFCKAIGVEIDYLLRQVQLYFIKDINKPIEDLTANELINGDSFMVLNYNEPDWHEVIEANVGTYQALRARLAEAEEAAAAAVHPIGHNGGRRRKTRQRKTRHRKSRSVRR